MQRKTNSMLYSIILREINFKCFDILCSFSVQNKMHNSMINLYSTSNSQCNRYIIHLETGAN